MVGNVAVFVVEVGALLLELAEVGAIALQAVAQSAGATPFDGEDSGLWLAGASVGIGGAAVQICVFFEFGGLAFEENARLVEDFGGAMACS